VRLRGSRRQQVAGGGTALLRGQGQDGAVARLAIHPLRARRALRLKLDASLADLST